MLGKYVDEILRDRGSDDSLILTIPWILYLTGILVFFCKIMIASKTSYDIVSKKNMNTRLAFMLPEEQILTFNDIICIMFIE